MCLVCVPIGGPLNEGSLLGRELLFGPGFRRERRSNALTYELMSQRKKATSQLQTCPSEAGPGNESPELGMP